MGQDGEGLGSIALGRDTALFLEGLAPRIMTSWRSLTSSYFHRLCLSVKLEDTCVRANMNPSKLSMPFPRLLCRSSTRGANTNKTSQRRIFSSLNSEMLENRCVFHSLMSFGNFGVQSCGGLVVSFLSFSRSSPRSRIRHYWRHDRTESKEFCSRLLTQ